MSSTAQSTPEVHQLVDHFFRHESARMVCTLTRLFNLQGLEVAEDLVQETLMEALQRWSLQGVPQNPGGWLMTVAKRKAVSRFRKAYRTCAHDDLTQLGAATTHPQQLETEIETVFLPDEITDSQLRMMFTCCHPALPQSAQIALTLKTLCGFSLRETAHSLMCQEHTIEKRLYRARQKFRSGAISFEIPQGADLAPRLESVQLCLYLLFNAGYHTHQDTRNDLVSRDMCLEAVRLMQLLLDRYPQAWNAHALLALMLFQAARFNTRQDAAGRLVLLEEQDRRQWLPELIACGVHHLSLSAQAPSLSVYHLEAGIAAEHCRAGSFSATHWNSIYAQYQLLYRLKPTPVVDLNMAIAQSRAECPHSALERLNAMPQRDSMQRYPLYYATLGQLLQETGALTEARQAFEQALKLTHAPAEQTLLRERLQRLPQPN